jgi:hypothetical protein
MEAMNGILMAGLSAAILFAVLHRLVERRLADPEPGYRSPPPQPEPGRRPLAETRSQNLRA